MAVIEGAGSGGTTTFNEVNAGNDFNKVMEQARTVQQILANGAKDIEEDIATNSENAAYSGAAAQEILTQWEDLASTFNEFLSNFKKWHQEGTENAKEYLRLQDETRTVKMEEK